MLQCVGKEEGGVVEEVETRDVETKTLNILELIREGEMELMYKLVSLS